MQPICRRTFLKRSAAAGAAILMGEPLLATPVRAAAPLKAGSLGTDVSVVTGTDYMAATLQAVARLGGMPRFVPRGAKVGLLVNSPFKHFGASVNPEVVLAVIRMCREAGAGEIRYLKDPHSGYWERSPLSAKHAADIDSLKFESGGYRKVAIADGLALKSAKVTEALFDCDVFIDVAIAKHHEGVGYTGALKNMMGLCPFSTNSFFHFGGQKAGWYADVHHLSQCIADLNLVRAPDLCIADATAFITDNGPWGPGTLRKPQKVVAAPNRVSLDAYCCTLLDLKPQDVLPISKAALHGLGEMDLRRLHIIASELS